MVDLTGLHPTKARVALLADVANRRVIDDDDFAPHLQLSDEDGTARVAEAIWEMERAGWVTQPTGTRVWELTAAGLDVLTAGPR